MMPQKISHRIAADRLVWVEKMLAELRSLPLQSKKAFLTDNRNVWAAESCLRRALEALFDLGRHILAKGFAVGVSEYKEIAQELHKHKVLHEQDGHLMRTLAGYRNRLVHFYHEVSAEELYAICSTQLGDVEHLALALRKWFSENSDKVDHAL